MCGAAAYCRLWLDGINDGMRARRGAKKNGGAVDFYGAAIGVWDRMVQMELWVRTKLRRVEKSVWAMDGR